ncbi:MAG: amino acid permease [Hellea sp.]
MEIKSNPSGAEKPKMGFWQCWAMSVGVMIGSGVFLLPTVLAPFGSISFLGWIATSSAAIIIALILGRLASRTDRTGGFYVYTQESFGDLAGFLIGWGYWLGIIFAITAISTAFVGYLSAVIPAIGVSNLSQAITAAIVIWTFAAINIKGVGSGARVQLVTTILKLIPLGVIIILGLTVGTSENIPAFNPQDQSIFGAVAATAMLTMWAFVGLEAGTVAAGDVIDPKRTIPRAIVAGTLTVTFVYIAATAAVMMLVPADILKTSEAPFVEAARTLGPLGAGLIAFGALISTAGSLNGNIFLGGQMPMALAIDGLAPKVLSRKNKGGSSVWSLIISCLIATVLLVFNYQEGLIAAFTFLISMSTLCTLLPYAVSSIAEFRQSRKSSKGWALIALIAIIYVAIAMIGSGVKILAWGVILILAGLPLNYLNKKYSYV